GCGASAARRSAQLARARPDLVEHQRRYVDELARGLYDELTLGVGLHIALEDLSPGIPVVFVGLVVHVPVGERLLAQVELALEALGDAAVQARDLRLAGEHQRGYALDEPAAGIRQKDAERERACAVVGGVHLYGADAQPLAVI